MKKPTTEQMVKALNTKFGVFNEITSHMGDCEFFRDDFVIYANMNSGSGFIDIFTPDCVGVRFTGTFEQVVSRHYDYFIVKGGEL